MEKDNFSLSYNMKEFRIMIVSEFVRRYMEQEGLAIHEFAKKAGVSQGTVKSFINYKPDKPTIRKPNPTTETLEAICKACGKKLYIGEEWK